MKNPFKNLFKKSDPKAWDKDTRHVVEYAFTLGGVHYFRMADYSNIYYERANKARDFYNELQMKVDKDLLEAHCTKQSDLLNELEKAFDTKNGELSLSKVMKTIVKIRQFNNDILDRLSFVSDPELIYKLASVVYFDKNESAYEYDGAYCASKIAKWKEHGMASFFLKIPLPELLPSIDFSKLDLESFTKSMLVVAKDTVNQIDNYLEQNSSMDQKTELWKRLTERREQLKASLQSVNSPLTNTTA